MDKDILYIRMAVLIVIIAMIGIFIYFNDCEYECERPKGCFYEWDLSWECHYHNGSMIPITEKVGNTTQKYYTCTKLDYKVIAC